MKNICRYFRIAGLISGLIAGALLGSVCVHAQGSPSVTLNFSGTYNATTCALVSSPDMTVTLPTLSTQSLPTAGAIDRGSKFFTITIQCPSGVTGARVYFESGSSTDPNTGNLDLQNASGAASATNVQVMLANEDGSRIKVGDRSTMRVVPITSTDPTPVKFIASYYATGRATAGTVNTFVTYVVEMP
ncbi:major type 1 subunit fimbrin (pilin) [Paraburkholderia sp. MM5496-R1]|uniref:Major type 1 subunit fimbrin (Pilin) n=1 Tax=Paraburkholderia tuberum TaxID=157910 RepID=A0A1H1K8F9_9BURK|nr:fimbrial protein [Paraburkholderia tuberum]SDR58594.1 major type 1 subunit fimbrin (pilin) [Paraburkholderia tuberum]